MKHRNLSRGCALILGLALFSTASLAHAQWDPNQPYMLYTRFKGAGKPMGVIEAKTDFEDLQMQTRNSRNMGQYWQITPAGGGYYRISSILKGKSRPIDIYNGGTKNNRAHLDPIGPFTGQYFKITSIGGGYYRLTTRFRGTGLSLEGFGGSTQDRPCLKPSGNYTGQHWRIVPVELPNQLLYYKFDRARGKVAVNYGTAPTSSTMVNAGASPWRTPGRYGRGMLRGSAQTASDAAYCDTGYRPRIIGDFTVHWWMKERAAIGNNNRYVFGGTASNAFRCFNWTGTTAPLGGNLSVRMPSGTTTLTINFPNSGATAVARARASGGACFGLTVKGKTAQWYVNGKPHGGAITLPSAPAMPASTGTLKIGRNNDNILTSPWDIDEFRLLSRAAAPAEIALWHQRAFAGAGRYGRNCGVLLGTSGGPPRVGNRRYTHTIAGPPSMRFLFVVGVRQVPSFDMGIVFPALRGCTWYSAFDIQIVSATGSTGRLNIPGAVPNTASIAGATLDTQLLGFTGSSPSRKYQSNAVSHKVEIY